MKIRLIAYVRILCLIIIASGPLKAIGAEKKLPESENEQVSYSVGYQIGGDLKKLEREVDQDGVRQGLADVRTNTPALDRDQMRAIIREFQAGIVAAREAEMVNSRKNREESRDLGRKFLVSNAKKEGVVTLPSGLQYMVLTVGQGRRPGPDDMVLVNYRGTTAAGKEFYDTGRKGGPVELRIRDAISGLREAIPLMKEGAHWRIFIPEVLAYGERGPLADQTVIFDLELVEIK